MPCMRSLTIGPEIAGGVIAIKNIPNRKSAFMFFVIKNSSKGIISNDKIPL